MKILMVCLGNICRSPMAQGILEAKIRGKNLNWEIDSAGTSGWHDGEGPDKRAILAGKKKGVDISKQVSRKIMLSDLDYYDFIFAMDSTNYQDIIKICSTETQKSKVKLIMNLKYPGMNMAVPDPYYDGKFDDVFELLNDAMDDVI
ncbi:MAG: low molecular weight protein-tyrosine-phosphatase, partial [Saprospiraceae bacterium]